MYYTYILYSEKRKTFYKGSTSDLTNRIKRHNSGFEKYSKAGAPWRLIWVAEKSTRAEAMVLERKLKNLTVKRLLLLVLKYPENVPGSDELLLIQKLSEC